MHTWEDILYDYVYYLKFEKHVSPATVEGYINDIHFFREFSEKHQQYHPATIDYDFIQQYVFEYAKKGYSSRSQARMISSLKSIFKFLQLEKRREDNPTELLESPKIGRKLPDVLSEEEIDLLINQIDRSTPEGERNKTILEVLYGCGLRVSELIGLQISHIYPKENYILVLGKGRKERLVPISDHTLHHIDIYTNQVRSHIPVQKGFEDIVFLNRRGKSITRNMIFLIIKELQQKAGITKNVSPHTFRHSFATHMLENGADLRSIQLMLGHESITTTEIYAHMSSALLQKTVLQYHPRNINK